MVSVKILNYHLLVNTNGYDLIEDCNDALSYFRSGVNTSHIHESEKERKGRKKNELDEHKFLF